MSKRVDVLLNHFSPLVSSEVSQVNVSASSSNKLNIEKMKKLLNGNDTKYRDEVFDFIRREPLFKLDYNHTKEAMRAVTRSRVQRLLAEGFITVTGFSKDLEKFNQYSEAMSYHDSSFNTLIGAHFVLFTGSIYKLGTEFHHKNFLDRAEKALMRGCFALTELGHGSNVRGIETTAVYDHIKKEFVINTPTETSQKYWIGGGYEWAQYATVFAQLYVNNVCFGVHAFIVPLRDERTNKILPGVRIKDCGHKMGLNGVDNGRFWFDHVRIPKDYLLNRYAQINDQGEYESVIPDNDSRFAITMGNLLTGRVGIVKGSTNASKIALITAIKYSFSRRQFGPPGEQEIPIIEYITQQCRLFPLLATTYAHQFIAKRISDRFHKAQEEFDIDAIKEIHVLLSGLKALCSWHGCETLQVCREACGGQGFKSSNRIGTLKADADVQMTYEGDNMVLLQQVCKDLAKSDVQQPLQLLNDLEIREKCDPEYIQNAESQLKVFQLREKDLIYQFKQQFQQAKNRGLSSDKALQACSLVSIEAGRAYIESMILQEFIETEKTSDPSLKHSLGLLRSLYALSRFETSASFLRGQYFSIQKQAQIRTQFLKVCTDIKEIAIDLVHSFDIPDFLLGTIAGDWIEANKYGSEDSP